MDPGSAVHHAARAARCTASGERKDKKTRPAEAGLKIQFVNATRNQAVLL
jgi:hypothetical protein